eukprot:1950266-Lingulodinium_polyedra.AAC.1
MGAALRRGRDAGGEPPLSPRARAALAALARHAPAGSPERGVADAALQEALSGAALALRLATLQRHLKDQHRRAVRALVDARRAAWRAKLADK